MKMVLLAVTLLRLQRLSLSREMVQYSYSYPTVIRHGNRNSIRDFHMHAKLKFCPFITVPQIWTRHQKLKVGHQPTPNPSLPIGLWFLANLDSGSRETILRPSRGRLIFSVICANIFVNNVSRIYPFR